MEICAQVNNQTDFDFSKTFFERILEETIGLSGVQCLGRKKIELSIGLVGEKEIAGINAQYRAKDKATDVLSFAEYASRVELCAAGGDEVLLGELIICPAYVSSSAESQDFTLENEMVYVVSHGILHLMGFDHGEEMFAIQEQVVNKIIEKTYGSENSKN